MSRFGTSGRWSQSRSHHHQASLQNNALVTGRPGQVQKLLNSNEKNNSTTNNDNKNNNDE